MKHCIEDLHDLLASNLCNCCSAGLNNFSETSTSVYFGEQLLKLLCHEFEGHLFYLPVRGDQAKGHFPTETCFNSSIPTRFIVYNDVFFLNLLEALLN